MIGESGEQTGASCTLTRQRVRLVASAVVARVRHARQILAPNFPEAFIGGWRVSLVRWCQKLRTLRNPPSPPLYDP